MRFALQDGQVNWGSTNTNNPSMGSFGFGVLVANQANDPRFGQVSARIDF